MNIRPLESLTKEELIELIRHERDHSGQPLTMAPVGVKLVPVEPKNETIEAVKLFSHGRSTTLYKKVTTPTDSEMLDWLIDNEALICHSVTDNLYEVWFDIDNIETGKTAREAISKAMRGKK